MVLSVILITAVAIIFYLWKRETRERSEVIFKSLIEAAPDAMVVVNDKGIIILVNQQTETLFGYRRMELIGQPVEKLIPQELHQKHHNYRKKYNEEPKFRSMGAGLELQGVKKGEVRFPVEISLSPVRTAKGILVSASVRDITDRKKAEQKFRGLLDAAPDATVIVTNTGIIEMINKQTENIFGYTREEMIGQPIEILIPEEIRAKHVGHRNSFIRQAGAREMGVGIELKAVRKNGTQFPVEISLSPIQTEEGMLISASVRDISERKQAQLALIKLNEELEHRVIERAQELHASERRFRALVENNDGIIALLDEKMNVVYRSPSSEHITGWSSNERELIGSLNQTHPDDLHILQKAISYIFQEPGKV